MAKTAEQLVAEAKRRIRSATPDAVAEAVLSAELVVVDVREPDEFAKGHIPGAINIPRGWLEFKADPTCPAYDERLAADRTLLIACAIGGRSALAAAALQELDYASVTNLEGGFEAWKRAGYAVERAEAAPVAYLARTGEPTGGRSHAPGWTEKEETQASAPANPTGAGRAVS